MKPKVKSFLSNFFLGLFSNDRAIEGSKTNPWWVCLIIALLAVLLPVLPITITQANSKGDDFLSGNVHRFDQNIAALTVDLANANKEFKVDENKNLLYYENNAVVQRDSTAEKSPVAAHISRRNNGQVEQYELLIYYADKTKAEIVSYIKEIDAITYKIGTIEATDENYEGTAYAPSYVVLFKQGIYTRINQEDSTSLGNNTYTAYSSDWKYFKTSGGPFELIKNALPEGKSVNEVDLNDTNDVKSIFTNWRGYYKKAYISQRNYNTWMTTVVFYGIYAALVFIMGLLIFLLTRGKANMFNYLKFIDTQKIVWWSCLAPAILAMILGFIIPTFAQMAFIILLGLRTMWMSMKQLRPQY